MRYEPIPKIMQLAIRPQGARLGLTIDDIEADFNVSRRTAEHFRDAVGQSVGPLEEVETSERRKRWRLRSDSRRQLIRVAPGEFAESSCSCSLRRRWAMIRTIDEHPRLGGGDDGNRPPEP